MVTLSGKAGQFLALHTTGQPLLQPNAWDVGSARVLVALGFQAIATTSSGFAATLGRSDGRVTVMGRSEVTGSRLTVVPVPGATLVYADDALVFALSPAEGALEAGLQVGGGGGTVNIESIRILDRTR